MDFDFACVADDLYHVFLKLIPEGGRSEIYHVRVTSIETGAINLAPTQSHIMPAVYPVD